MHDLPHASDSETISISIGLGSATRAASSIVLPRGHDLVKHLERLLPQIAQAAATAQYEHEHQSPQQQQQDSRYNERLAPALHRHSMMQNQRHHPYMASAPPHRYAMPQSPYASDSSLDSTARSHNHSAFDAHQHVANGRRRRGAVGQSSGKKCQFPDCEKISVSRGLCRGHGGGRRCQFTGCSKGAQSRSDFCWAHGGGQRCEVTGCMRSRKSKRFCVAHLSWESVGSDESALLDSSAYRTVEPLKPLMPKSLAPLFPAPPRMQFVSAANAKLPSLQQALQKNQNQIPNQNQSSSSSSQCVSAATGRPTFVHEQYQRTAVLNGASC